MQIRSVNTLIVGAGAAGLKCAAALLDLGIRDIAIAVDRLGNGTSNQSGSDKQTYYKLGLFGAEPDSPMDFARSLFQGGMMHGDLAYIEALGSAPAFFELCRLGVPFPRNEFGAYVGYKTDHDPRQRATSAGPKTSRFMYECLLARLRRDGIAIFDHHPVVRLLCGHDAGGQGRIIGALCQNLDDHYREHFGLTLFNAQNVVMATGGPGELYRISVWPHGQAGAHGMILAAGAAANNLTELQYGLASRSFRWNLSGTYQQVIPDYFSTDSESTGTRRHFLHDYFADMGSLASAIFLKGYQWPFHAARLQDGGSSLIDLAVHREIEQGRRVFLDFTRNPTPAPGMSPFSLSLLSAEARQYLEASGATQATPYERLQHMNPESIDLYAEHHIDLRMPLDCAVCAQHCNGGISGNTWWETSVPHLFAIGELAGTHGVRPGGSALNSGQVGAMRAAEYIAHAYNEPPMPIAAFVAQSEQDVLQQLAEFRAFLGAQSQALAPATVRRDIQERMSRAGGFIRSLPVVRHALAEARELVDRIAENGFACQTPRQLANAAEVKWLALTSVAFLNAIEYYIETGGGSRGGYMILDAEGPLAVRDRTGSQYLQHRAEDLAKREEIIQLSLCPGTRQQFAINPIPRRPLPVDTSWFESTWSDWRSGAIYRNEN